MHKIINADIFAALKSLDNNVIDIAITSPPYWAQRNYGFDKQIGNEPTYMEFISRLTFLFDILKEKLVSRGVFFLNIGDKYLIKYGKTPLGLIPYNLAHFMSQNGWIINDTIIWYKPNHMPSSVKNRFVNSYEPIFVLSKNEKNYFTDYTKKNPDYENFININLQPTSYKHVAAYPEKLVSKLLDCTIIKKDYTVLDPFAGSGTTLKVVNERNDYIFNNYNATGIMIEFNEEYVEIIKERSKLKKINVQKLGFEQYYYPTLHEKPTINFDDYEIVQKIKTINVLEDKNEFFSILNTIQTRNFITNFPKDEILFLGLKDFTIEDIYNISFVKNWIIRNKLVVKNKKWFPIFMFVHDNKKFNYNFNYTQLQLNHKLKEKSKYKEKDFIGFKVVNTLLKEKKEGVIIDVISKYDNHLPKYVKVLWQGGDITQEFIISDQDDVQRNIKQYHINGFVSIKEKEEIIPLNKIIDKINYISLKKYLNGNRKIYRGKFKEIERKNWGASPGARNSVDDEYFSVQRLYNVKQNIIADYLNHIREKRKLSKKAFASLFPKDYLHTVGHWLRKDFGGSVPVIEDWEKIEQHFEINNEIKKYTCKTALKLQTVTKTKYKIPDDVIDVNLIDKLEVLNKKV